MFRTIVKPFNLIKTTYKVAMLTVVLLLSIATAYASQVNLAWDASSSSNVAGYHVVYGQTSSSYATQIDAGSSTQYTVANLDDGKTYYFAVHAHNADDSVSSANSNEVSKQLPAVAPIASFSAGITSGTVPLTVAFTNGSTGTAPLTYSWTFGDGSTSTAQNPSKTYSSTGTYTVTLVVTGPSGNNTLTRTDYIAVTNPAVTAPVASFIATPTSGAAPLLVTLGCNSTGTITNRSWDFGVGDGTTSTAQTAVKTYNTAGTYTVKLTVSNSGGSSTATKTISTTAMAPVASFTATPTSGVAPLATTFTNSSTGAISYTWSFGDNTADSIAQNPTHTFAGAGTYTVKLTATGPTGTTPSTQSETISVTAASAGSGPIAAYNFEEASGTTVVDASGNGNHGIITEALRTVGKYGNALSFDGINDRVTVNDSAFLDLTTSMTLEAWVYPTAISGNRTVLVKENAAGGSVYYLYANVSDDAPNKPIGGGVFAGAYQFASGGATLTANTWTHVAVTYDGITERLYVNGSQVASKAQTGSIDGSSGVLRIGGNNTWGEYFKGRIDEIRIYNRALSAMEISTDMNTAVAVSSPPKKLLGADQFTVADSTLASGVATAFQTSASVTGRVISLPVHVNASSTSIKLVAGIYKDSNGHPGALLAQGTLSSPVAGTWNKVLLPPVAVNAGTKYWVAILSPSNSGKLVADKVSGSVARETSKTTSLTKLPSTWSTGTVSSGDPLSGYGAGY